MNAERWVANEFSQWANDIWFLLPNWKWVGLVIALLAGVVLNTLLRQLFRRMKNSEWARGRATGFILYFLDTNLQAPLAWILTSLFWTASIDALTLTPGLDKYLKIAAQLILSFNIIILVYRAVEALGEVLLSYTSKTENTLDDQLAPMATKVLKVFVVIFGILVALQNFGVNVMSVLAGLGLGGLALALAAQDTAANLFGSIMIVLDRPFRIGDFINVASVDGKVEEIGFRSTRLRTTYNSLVTIPNSVVAKEKIDNFEVRPQRRVRHVLGLSMDAKEDQIRAYMNEIESFFKGNAKIDQTSYIVRLQAMGDFSFQILVQFFVLTRDWTEEMNTQQEFLFHAMRSAEKVKVEFAYPTSTQIVKLMDYQAVQLMGEKPAPTAQA